MSAETARRTAAVPAPGAVPRRGTGCAAGGGSARSAGSVPGPDAGRPETGPPESEPPETEPPETEPPETGPPESARPGPPSRRRERRPATEAEAKALASAVRLRILRLCLDRALTNKAIAVKLGANPATILHHVRTLVATGFLAAQPARRGNRGAREVPYLATGKSFWLDDAESGPEGQGAAMIDAFLDEVRLVDPDRAGLARLGLRLSDAELTELRERIQEILDDFAGRPPNPDGRPYSLFFAIFDDVSRA